MTVNDIKIIQNEGWTKSMQVDDRNSSLVGATIKAGEPVGQSERFITLLDDDDPRLDISDATGRHSMLGIAASTSTETATADGAVEVNIVISGFTVMRGKASTTTNVDTASELVAYINDEVNFGLDTVKTTGGGIYTIDEDDADPNVHGLHIIDGSGDSSATLDVVLKHRASDFGTANA